MKRGTDRGTEMGTGQQEATAFARRRPANRTRWTAADLPDQRGRTVIVTGASSGLGAVAARELARAGARVILAVRNPAKGQAVAAAIALPPGMAGAAEVRRLDLADLASVRAFAAGVGHEVDVLVNNAGIMFVPSGRTADGFELQLGTNHLGHFALTGLLLDRLRDRVVTVTSKAAQLGRIRLDDPHFTRGYDAVAAYQQSKLANLLFTFELQRRLRRADSPLRALSAHPGWARSNLFAGAERSRQVWLMRRIDAVIAQRTEQGALPTLYAATVDLPSGSHVGPGGFLGLRGHPRIEDAGPTAQDVPTAEALWGLSERMTGVHYDLGRRATT
jgi:NAD(P)-dependent dehydrogenase (short-subunit alcohol dehydrogenase family)